MTESSIRYEQTRELPVESVLRLYRANAWPAADRPAELYQALLSSHSLVTAWDGSVLVGLANAITDGHLVVYFPHLLVLPQYQRQGIGQRLMHMIMKPYQGFHQQILVAEPGAIEFYRRIGFQRAGDTEPMEICAGSDH